MSQELLSEEQSIVGVTRHNATGGYIVWVSLDGNDVTPVGAWKGEAVAGEMVQETADEFHRLVDAMDRAAETGSPSQLDQPNQAEEAGIKHWTAFLADMEARSDAPVTSFSEAQLAEIGRHITALIEQRRNVPCAPEGFARVLLYSDAALAGVAMPRVRLAPMNMPPPRRSKKGR